jgi:hypothetical protein
MGASYRYYLCPLAMKYKYLEFPNRNPNEPSIYRPFLAVRMTSGGKFTDTFCLVDSGADCCMMPAALGRLIGIDIESGAQQEIRGIAHQAAKTYRHFVHITVPRLGSFDTNVAFSTDLRYGILGQEGFFEKFRVIFDRKKLLFEVIDA